MSIKKFFIISLIIGLLIPFITHAQIKITEIMYDPAGSDTKREWVEVYNSGTQDIDLSTWFFYEGNVFHKLTALKGSILGAGSYAIIVDSVAEVVAEYSDYTGLIFDSVFSLNNTGETISMANSQKEIVDTFTYNADMGANNNGQSLQITNGEVITAGPTFGETNKTESEIVETEKETTVASSTTSGSTSNSSSRDLTHTQQVSVTNYVPTSPFKIGAGRDRVVSIHAPIDFEAYVSKTENKPSFKWNFGDFSTDTGRKVEHIYRDTGAYQVVLEGKSKDYIGISRTEVSVIEPVLEITRSTTSIDIHNKANQEINLGYFVVNFEEEKKGIPKNTIVSGGATIRMPVATSTVLQSFEYPDGTIYQEFDTIYEVIQ